MHIIIKGEEGGREKERERERERGVTDFCGHSSPSSCWIKITTTGKSAIKMKAYISTDQTRN